MGLYLQIYGMHKNLISCFKNQADKMNDLINKFEKTHTCPKCANSYFTLNVNWLDTHVKTVYTCESCNWSFYRMSSCTSPSSAPAPSLPSQSVVFAQPARSK